MDLFSGDEPSAWWSIGLGELHWISKDQGRSVRIIFCYNGAEYKPNNYSIDLVCLKKIINSSAGFNNFAHFVKEKAMKIKIIGALTCKY